MAKIVSRGDPIEPVYLNNLKVAAHGWGVISGLAVSQRGAGANMSVDVATGEAWINGTGVVKSSTTNVAITAAHASYDRYDLVVINSSGTISVIDGTAATTSYANDYDLETNNAILLAEVYVPATDTTIEDAQITDKQIISFVEEINSAVGIGLEEYSNHLGATDNFTQTATSGNGTATADSTNHEMDLSTGITIVGHARFEAKKTFTISANPIVINFIVQNITNGTGGVRRTYIGLKDDFSSITSGDGIFFRCDENNVWSIRTESGGSSTTIPITALVNGDLLTIVATSEKLVCMVNGSVVKVHTLIPTGGLYFGASVITTSTAATSSRAVSIDMMGIKAYQ